MTAQIPDRVIYNGEHYDIVGLKGANLLTPADFEMVSVGFSSACWRGYYATYSVIDHQLFLTQLSLHARDGDYKPIDGVLPEREEQNGKYRSDPTYKGLRVKAPFTGRLLLGRNFIGSMYVHMGFQKPPAFETVIELLIENGDVQEVFDHSELMAHMRAELEARRNDPNYQPRKLDFNAMAAWIDHMFSLDYDF